MSLMGDAIEKAMSALERAEVQFTRYAVHHRAKGADDKAATNYGYATMCGDALEHLKVASDELATYRRIARRAAEEEWVLKSGRRHGSGRNGGTNCATRPASGG